MIDSVIAFGAAFFFFWLGYFLGACMSNAKHDDEQHENLWRSPK